MINTKSPGQSLVGPHPGLTYDMSPTTAPRAGTYVPRLIVTSKIWPKPPYVPVSVGAGASGVPAERGGATAAGANASVASLPSLSCNISILGGSSEATENPQDWLCTDRYGPRPPDPWYIAPVVPSGAKKDAETLFRNIEAAVEKFGPDRCGFVTFTVPPEADAEGNPILDAGGRPCLIPNAEMSRRFNSLNTNVLHGLFLHHIAIKEPHLGGGKHHGQLHYHLFVVTHQPITCNNDQVMDKSLPLRKRYKSANPELRRIWRVLRKRCVKYGFGRHEVLPVRRNAEAIARYLAKYLLKCILVRGKFKTLKGVRMVNYSKHYPRVAFRLFSWVGAGATQWRGFVRHIAHSHGVASIDQMSSVFGSRWAHRLSPIFRAMCAHNERPEQDDPWDVTLPSECVEIPRPAHAERVLKLIDGLVRGAKLDKARKFLPAYVPSPGRGAELNAAKLIDAMHDVLMGGRSRPVVTERPCR